MVKGVHIIDTVTSVAIILIGIFIILETVSFIRNAIKKSTFGELVYKAKLTIGEDIFSVFMLILSSALMIYQHVQRRNMYMRFAKEFPNYAKVDASTASIEYRWGMALLIGVFVCTLVARLRSMLVGFKIYEEGLVTNKGSWYWEELDYFSITEDDQELLYIITNARWFKKKHFFLKEACKAETYSLLATKLEQRTMDEQ